MSPSVSLCMIVRDVEQTIEECLASIAPYVSEIIVTDTGSRDRTKEAIRASFPQVHLYDFNEKTHPESFVLDVEETWTNPKMPGPFSGKHMLADFGAARQFGWDKAKSDYVMWMDSDDIFEGGEELAEVLQIMSSHNIDTALLNYDYATDERGNVICKLTRERIMRRTLKARWQQPIHEVYAPIGVGQFFTQCNIRHRRHELQLEPLFHHRNLKVLGKWWDKHKGESDPEPRMLFYLGMEERFVWPDKSIEHFEKYCEVSGWDEERGVAHMLAGTVHEGHARLDKAFSHYAQAALEAHWNPDPYFGAARIAYFKRDWSKCTEWSEKGFELAKKHEGRQSVLMYDPMDRVYRPYIYYSVALLETGRVEEAIKACDQGLKYNPQDPHLLGNKEAGEKYLASQGAQMNPDQRLSLRVDNSLDAPSQQLPLPIFVTVAIEMWKQNMEAGLFVRALQLIDALPETLSLDPHIRRARDATLTKLDRVEDDNKKVNEAPPIKQQEPKPVPAHTPPPPKIQVDPNKASLDILIWTGPGWEEWSPDTLDTVGLGGSETAAICMAREFVKLGHKIRVASHCGSRAGNYDGVDYVHFQDVINNPGAYACDILVSSRQVGIFDFPIPHKASFVWVHDIHLGDPGQPNMGRWLIKPDRYFCLSEWHKSFFLQVYPFIHRENVIVTKNGLDLNYFKSAPVKDGNRLIYSSSPDRGLERLLELFPRIRKEVPDAQLDVYYGFQTWRSMAANNKEELAKIDKFERLLEEQKDSGVTYHGRVSKPELAKAFLRSKVWGYPTWFTETYCITALEAMASSCVPVTTALAALPETVSHGFVFQADSKSEQYATAFVKRVVRLLKDEEERSKYAQAGREYAFNFHGWDKVAEKWVVHFRDVLREKQETTIHLPRFGV